MAESEKQGSLLPLSLPSPTPCRIIKCVVEPGGRVRKGTILLTYSTDLSSAEPGNETVLKSTLVGVVKERLYEEGEVVQPGYVRLNVHVLAIIPYMMYMYMYMYMYTL